MSEYNKLVNETSPYLFQHAKNPVNWYPWGEEAFSKAKEEDKPIFLSIGYSTCHWCHVMAHESFENADIAGILNENYISIKVDKEERPDIDSIYMRVCQAYTGSGGWPTSIFMTPDQKPFFAGTYFPPQSRYGTVGFTDLLIFIAEKWKSNRKELLKDSEKIVAHINDDNTTSDEINKSLIDEAISYFKKVHDKTYGGFGKEPKFPTPHNLIFLLEAYQKSNDESILNMVERTLMQMYRGGIFDHIGYGFSRYSTDRYYLVPHFEKMLYDNALLIIAYTKAYSITHKSIYKDVAQKTAEYILREMTNTQGGFYSAQDADSDGVEGKYYVFDKDEIIKLLGQEDGEKFCSIYDITPKGNFEGKNIANLLKSETNATEYKLTDEFLPKIYEYRKSRCKLHLDDKILTSWNSLMISAFAYMYKVFKDKKYLEVAEKAYGFIEENLIDEGNGLFVSFRNGNRTGKGFIDDYAFYIFSLINLYDITLKKSYLDKSIVLTEKATENFYDKENGGFFLYGNDNEQLITKPKETYDGALPSGNSVMCYNLLKLSLLCEDKLIQTTEQQLKFMSGHAMQYPGGYCFYLSSLLIYLNPPKKVVCVLAEKGDIDLIKKKNRDSIDVLVLENPTEEYRICNQKTTFYVCDNQTCYPPTNNIEDALA